MHAHQSADVQGRNHNPRHDKHTHYALTRSRAQGTPLSPDVGNVCFASAIFGFSFTIEQFARIYADTYGGFDPVEFAKRLWGDYWFDEHTRKFKKTAPPGGGNRAFVHFVIEPLYKMFSQIVGEEPQDLR